MLAGHDVAGKTGTAQVISNEGAEAREGKTDKDLRDQRLVRVHGADATIREIAGVVLVEHGEPRRVTARADRAPRLDTYFAQARRPCRCRRRRSRSATPTGPAPVAKPRVGRRRPEARAECSSAASITTSTGC